LEFCYKARKGCHAERYSKHGSAKAIIAMVLQYSKHFAIFRTMKTYHVYILLCSDGMYYTGVTNNLDTRLQQHQNGIDPKAFTYKRRPVKLVFNEVFGDINQAIAFEKQVKGWRREKKEAIINGDWDRLPRLTKPGKPKGE
jgi:putative endonuclease